jgi:VWFA-related protein
VRSDVVLVPTLVKNKAGDAVLALSVDDFLLTDNGAPQTLRLEPDLDALPLALVVIVQTGGQGATHLDDYGNLAPVLDAVIGAVPHRVAVVAFDSEPRLVLDFSDDTDAAAKAIAVLQPGDSSAAILDALKFGIDQLRGQPSNYRHAVVLLSETIDRSSSTTLEDAIRAVEDTNTSIYSFAFSSTHATVKHEGSELPGGASSKDPYPPGGCMSHDPNADPDAHGNRGVQALDCAGTLLPPLRLARIAFLAAKDSLQRNVPKSVAQLTGGEFFSFHNSATLVHHLLTVSNDIPNYYVLSFRPQSTQAGPHAPEVKLKNKKQYEVEARKGYWIDTEPQTTER